MIIEEVWSTGHLSNGIIRINQVSVFVLFVLKVCALEMLFLVTVGSLLCTLSWWYYIDSSHNRVKWLCGHMS